MDWLGKRGLGSKAKGLSRPGSVSVIISIKSFLECDYGFFDDGPFYELH